MPAVYDSAGVPKASGGAGGGVALSAVGGLASTGTVLFDNANGVSFGRAGQTFTGSVGAGATATGNFGGLSAGGGAVTSGTASFVNANGVSFTNNGQSFSGSVAMQTFSNVGGQGITFGLSGGTALTASVAPGGGATLFRYPHYEVSTLAGGVRNFVTTGATGGSTQSTASFWAWPMELPAAVSFTRVDYFASWATGVAGTGSVTRNVGFGLYTLNGGTALSLLSTFMWQAQITQSSISALSIHWHWGSNSGANSLSTAGNVSTRFTGAKVHSLYTGTGDTLSAGRYWLVDHNYARTGGVAAVWTACSDGRFQGNWVAQLAWGQAGVTGGQPVIAGAFSSTTNANNLTQLFMPSSINTTAISASTALGPTALFFHGGTA